MGKMILSANLDGKKKFVTLSGGVCVQLAAEGETIEKNRFTLLGYSGAPVVWRGYTFIIRLSGMRAKESFPVLHEHRRDKIVGYADGWGVDDTGFHVDGPFSDVTETAKEVFGLAKEGFPWQASIGVGAQKITSLERGKKEVVNGITVEGPIDIWEESIVSETSFVALGADDNTEARIDASKTQEEEMDKKLRALLVSLGLSENATDAEAWAFAKQKQKAGELDISLSADNGAGSGTGSDTTGSTAGGTENGGQADTPPASDPATLAAQTELAARNERERVLAINDMVGQFNLPASLSRELAQSGASLDEARIKVLAELAKTNPRINYTSMEEGESESDKFRTMAAQGVLLQLGHKPKEGEKVRNGAEDFRYKGLLDIARMCLARAGHNVDRMSKHQIAEAILSPRARLMASTSDFSGLFLDVANKILLKSYNEYPNTWRPFVTVINASDFKDIYGVILSGGPDLEDVDENEEYKHGQLKDGTEKFRVGKKGKIIDLSLEMIVNDKLGAFARLPELYGRMAARSHADAVYSKITGSPVMSDGKTLFHADHANLAATGAAPSVKALDLATQAITNQKGLAGETLDLTPRFLLVPPSLRFSASVLLSSASMPEPQMSSAVTNPVQDLSLTPVIDPRLETGAAAAKPWYLLADPTMANVISVAFLDGQEEPDVIEHEDFEVDAISYKVRTIMGVGVMDYRGAYKNPGVPLS